MSQIFGLEDLAAEACEAIQKERIIQLIGLPGTGKTTVAIYLVHQLDRTAQALWIMCNGYASLEQALLRVASFIDERTGTSSMVQAFKDPAIGENSKIEAVIRGIEDLNALVFIDDFSVFPRQSAELFLACGRRLLREGMLIVTAPTDLWSNLGLTIPTFHIPPLNSAAARGMLLQQCSTAAKSKINDSQFDNLVDVTRGHPLLIKLTASLLETFEVENLIADFGHFSEGLVNHVAGKAINELSPEHLKTLQYLSCFPLPFGYSAIADLQDVENAEMILLDLIRRSLVQKIGREKFTVHSIVESALLKTMSGEQLSQFVAQVARALLHKHSGLSVDEHVALIDLYIVLGDGSIAENLIKIFIHALMSLHLYALAEELLVGWLNHDLLREWDLGHFLMGRLLRIFGRHSDAAVSYRASMSYARSNAQQSLSAFELANCLSLSGGAYARQEAQELYEVMVRDGDLVQRVMGTMALCTMAGSERRLEYIPAVESLLREAEAEKSDVLVIKLRATLGECLIASPSRKAEGLELLSDTVNKMMESKEKGQYVLALRHFLKLIRDESKTKGDLAASAKSAGRLVTVMRWSHDRTELALALYWEGVVLCLKEDYLEASARLIESLSYNLLPDHNDVAAQAHITPWLAIALWHIGMVRISVACQVAHAYLCDEAGVERKPFVFVQPLVSGMQITDADVNIRPWLLRVLSNDEMGNAMKWREEFRAKVDMSGVADVLREIIRGAGDG